MESSAGDSNSRLPPYRFFNPLNRLLPLLEAGVHAGLLVVDGVFTDGREESGWTDGGRRVQGVSPHTHSCTHLSSFSCRAAGLLSPLWNELLRIKEQGGLTGGPQDWDWGAVGGLDYSGAVEQTAALW